MESGQMTLDGRRAVRNGVNGAAEEPFDSVLNGSQEFGSPSSRPTSSHRPNISGLVDRTVESPVSHGHPNGEDVTMSQ